MKDFRGLSVWQRAHAVTLGIYRATDANRVGVFTSFAPPQRQQERTCYG